MKRFLSLLVALVMVLSLVQLPAFAAAAEGTDYVIDGNTIRILTQAGWDDYFATANVAGNTVYLETDITIKATGLYVNCDLIGRKGGVENAAPDVTLRTLPMFSSISANASASYLNLKPAEDKEYAFTSSYQGVMVKEVKATNITVSHITNYIDASNTGSSIGLIGAVNNGTTITISDCVNYGDLTASGATSFGGGILAAARNADDVVKIERCYNYGNISAVTGAGGIFGSAYNDSATVTIDNCYNEGNISAATETGYNVGGIVGSTRGKIAISNSINKGTITGYKQAGGIAGGYTNALSKGFSATSCVNFGNVTATDRHVGGIVGAINDIVTISKCANYGNISTGEKGLLAGGIAGTFKGSIDQCFNEGNITSSGNVGGIAGNRNNADVTNVSISITNSYNAGNVTATNNYSAGIIYYAGYEASATAETNKISSVYNVGDVTSTLPRNEYQIARRIYKAADGEAIIENTYALTSGAVEVLNYNAVDVVSTVENGVLPANTEAGFERLPAGFNSDIWVACEGGYPILKNNLPKNADGTDKEYAVVTLTNGENGEAIKDAVTYVEKGSDYSVTLAPVTGYVVDTVTADGKEVEGAVNTYVVENVSDDIEVVVSYTTAPATEGVTNANRLFVATDDAYSLYAFGKYNVVEGNEAVDFGILVSFEAIDAEDFVITNEDVRKFSACIGEAAMGATEDGEYGVKLYGTMITEDGVYYCLPYAQYADGTVYYGTVMTVVND